MLRIHNVKINLGRNDYHKCIAQVLNVRAKDIKNVKLIKKSVDARRSHVHFICSFDFNVDDEELFLSQHKQVSKAKEYHYDVPLCSTKRKVMVIGSGPAGLFCAYVLSLAHMDVVLVERGKKVEERVSDVEKMLNEGVLNPSSNIAFGEGGAGTFSDGKLTTGVKNERLPFVLQTFVKFGAPQDILYEAKAHIGTDYLRKVIANMRKAMEQSGVTFCFETQMVDFENVMGRKRVSLKSHNEIKTMDVDDLVLAIGHSARDTYEMLYHKGLEMEQKAFAVGVRIEQSQEKINEIQYKKSAKSPYLKAAPYKLAVHTSEKRGVYTFCMCPGGEVVPSMHEEGTLCVNGMSYYARDKRNANSAILVNVKPEDFHSAHPLAGIEFQRELEKKAFLLGGSNYCAPVQLAEDYLNHRTTTQLKDLIPSYLPGYHLTDLHSLFPDFINRNLEEGLLLMNKRMPGFIDESTLLTGVEARSSAPVRILRNSQFVSNIKGIYPIGEGAGYAGGIMSAALDGILCAEALIKGNDENGSD